MKIELKNIKVYKLLSHDSNAFIATIYIDGIKAGVATDDGMGGETNYYGLNKIGSDLIEKAEEYCKTLPPDIVKIPGPTETEVATEMNLQYYLSKQVFDHLEEKESDRLRKQMEKKMVNNILYGVPGEYVFYTLNFKVPLVDILRDPKKTPGIKTFVQKLVIPELVGDIKILNTNIEPEVWVSLGINRDKIVNLPDKVGQLKRNKRTGNSGYGESKGRKP